MTCWPALALATPLVLVAMLAGEAQAADAPRGAASCTGCHATSGSVKTAIPSLVDKSAPAIAGIMREYKSGARPATIMSRIARGLSDSEIDAIAEWIARGR
jgi:sulfide dehydrogenase cytochrome subunit